MSDHEEMLQRVRDAAKQEGVDAAFADSFWIDCRRTTYDDALELLRYVWAVETGKVPREVISDEELGGGIGDARAAFAKQNEREKLPQTDVDAEKPSKIQLRRKR